MNCNTCFRSHHPVTRWNKPSCTCCLYNISGSWLDLPAATPSLKKWDRCLLNPRRNNVGTQINLTLDRLNQLHNEGKWHKDAAWEKYHWCHCHSRMPVES